MAYHAKLSPSGADRWMLCPGSVPLSEGIPDTSSSYADEGTVAHHIAAICLEDDLDPEEFLHDIYHVDEKGGCYISDEGHDVTSDMVRYIRVYLDSVRGQVGEGVLMVEQRLPIGKFTGEEGATGTADSVVITETGELQIHDLKYGMGKKVSADHNRQLMLYALGAIEEYSLVHTFDRVAMFIHQVRLSGTPEVWQATIEELEEFAMSVATAADSVDRAIANPGPEFFNPGEIQCQFCPAKADCPALSNLVARTVLPEFDDGQELTPDAVQDAVDAVGALSPASLSDKMRVAPLIEIWVKAIRAKVESDLLAGIGVPGYKLVRGKQGNRQWSDIGEAETQLKSMRLKVEEMYDLKLISPTTAEKLSKYSGPDGKPVIGPRQWKRLQDIIIRSEGGLSVAPESDKREAVVPSAKADDFDDLEQDLT